MNIFGLTYLGVEAGLAEGNDNSLSWNIQECFHFDSDCKTMKGQKCNLSSDFVFNPICGQCPPSGESFK